MNCASQTHPLAGRITQPTNQNQPKHVFALTLDKKIKKHEGTTSAIANAG